MTLQRPPAAVYHVALRLPLLSVACLGLMHFMSCCYCRRCSKASRAGAAPYPKTPAAPSSCHAGACWRSLLSLHLHTWPPAVSCEPAGWGDMQGCGELVLAVRDKIRGSQLGGGVSAHLASLPTCSLAIQVVVQHFLGSNRASSRANYNAAGPAASACCLWCWRGKGITLACSIVNGINIGIRLRAAIRLLPCLQGCETPLGPSGGTWAATSNPPALLSLSGPKPGLWIMDAGTASFNPH